MDSLLQALSRPENASPKPPLPFGGGGADPLGSDGAPAFSEELLASVGLTGKPAPQAAATPDTGALLEDLRSRGVRVVTFPDWQKIDTAEVEAGKKKGKPREKFTSVEDILALLD